MKNLFIVFPKASGGEYIATKNLATALKSLAPQNIYVNEVGNLDFVWDSSKSLQLIKSLFKSLYLYLKVFLKYKHKNIDFYYSNSLLFLFVSTLGCFFSNKKAKFFYHFHGRSHDSLFEEFKKEANILKKIFYIFPVYYLLSIIEKFALKKVAKVFLPSPSALEELEVLYKMSLTKTKIIPNGFDKKYFYPKKDFNSKKNKGFNLLYVGRIDPQKNIDLIIKTHQSLKTGITCSLDLVFPHITDKKTADWFYKLENKNRVNLHVDLKPKQIGSLYRGVDLTILLSSKDNFPLVFLESIACGTAVVISEIKDLLPLQKEIASFLIVKKIKLNYVKRVIIDYLNLSKDRQLQIRKNCLQVAKNYSWQKSAKLLFNNIIDEKH